MPSKHNNVPRAAMLAATAGALLSLAQTPVLAQVFSENPDGPRYYTQEELAKLIEAAQAYPLGSQKNPVRVHMPKGERSYLERLRCANGMRPTFKRIGTFGYGVYGRIIDGYEVLCEGSTPAKSMIYMDMYHGGHRESAAVPGFTIAPE
jgi:hypothetical protein